jgi:hypothetical protein
MHGRNGKMKSDGKKFASSVVYLFSHTEEMLSHVVLLVGKHGPELKKMND